MENQVKIKQSPPLRILIVEDDAMLAASIEEWFTLDGHSCDYAANGQEALSRLSTTQFDVVILDINLPLVDGLEVTQLIRKQGNSTPILMLTARDAINDRVAGLEAGADDYVVKPFSLEEVSARVHVLSIRRTGAVHRLWVGPLELLIDERRVRCEGREIQLSPIGWRLLETLARSSPAAVNRESLIFAAWGENPPPSNNLKVQIFKIRKAIDQNSSDSLIQSVPGLGYRLCDKQTQ